MATKFTNSCLKKGCEGGALLEPPSAEQSWDDTSRRRIWGSPAPAYWYLGIGVEPLGGGHEQLLVHAVKRKGQDCPGLLGRRDRR